MLIKLNYNVFVVARDDRAEPEFAMLDLSALSERRFACHSDKIPFYIIVTI